LADDNLAVRSRALTLVGASREDIGHDNAPQQARVRPVPVAILAVSDTLRLFLVVNLARPASSFRVTSSGRPVSVLTVQPAKSNQPNLSFASRAKTFGKAHSRTSAHRDPADETDEAAFLDDDHAVCSVACST
jgi:hypothetical protein